MAIIELGAVGASTLQAAVLSGARRIFVVEAAQWKRERAAEFGAAEVYPDIGLEQINDAYAELLGGHDLRGIIRYTDADR
ncbi:hypothetical protein [Nocardia jiangsuensis]|uniref:Zinc-binding dehydrogenase n=1 Tax=Nocardia jiangsuensis TaxID=1691563 RepID=A0ABV8DM32_9NOCA